MGKNAFDWNEKTPEPGAVSPSTTGTIVFEFTVESSLYHWLKLAVLEIAPRPFGPTKIGLLSGPSWVWTSPVTKPEIPFSKSGCVSLKSLTCAFRTIAEPVVVGG